MHNAQTRTNMEKCYLLLTLFISVSNAQLAFPEENPLASSEHVGGRGPVFVPGLCPVNQWYWPGNQETDWVCDCASRFVYYPANDTCFEIYRQGPCQNNEYLVLQKDKIIPECVINPCVNDTMVPFNDKCYRLYKTDACPNIGKDMRTLNVNPTSLDLECVLGNVAELSNVVQVGARTCLPGSKRSASGQCRVIAG